MSAADLVDVPARLTIDGRSHLVVDTMKNYHYRALVLPVGGGSPRWLSNAEVRALVEQPSKEQP